MQRSNSFIDTFYILDFDRTLARTDDLRGLYEKIIIDSTPVTREEIQYHRQRVKSNFDLAAYARQQLQKTIGRENVEETMTSIRQNFIAQARQQDLLEPYAAELLAYLGQQHLPFGILTTGGEEWQQTKIEAARLENVPHLIIPKPNKGELIASWQQQDGSFLLPDKLTGKKDILAKSLVFLDDKTISFQKIPSAVRAIRIISLSGQEPSEPELDVPPNVTTARGLKVAFQYLFQKI